MGRLGQSGGKARGWTQPASFKFRWWRVGTIQRCVDRSKPVTGRHRSFSLSNRPLLGSLDRPRGRPGTQLRAVPRECSGRPVVARANGLARRSKVALAVRASAFARRRWMITSRPLIGRSTRCHHLPSRTGSLLVITGTTIIVTFTVGRKSSNSELQNA